MSSSIEIKRLYSLDLPGPSDEPDDPENCWVRVYADIGPVDSPSADTFRLVVCTPPALSRELARSEVVWGSHLLVVPRFDWEVVKLALGEKINSLAADSGGWEEFVRSLGRYVAWEFEDFRE